jgi:hypothetical protein
VVSMAPTRLAYVSSTDSGRPKPPEFSSDTMPWKAARSIRTAWMSAGPSRWYPLSADAITATAFAATAAYSSSPGGGACRIAP